ncbi:MAG TPA: N-acetylmuramoyl-L-alanine amidase [Candidatus Baltobacteraceae bacterium]|nr:N-acetylmuramoyl-L-alanine amidase [Candidatus Baltobacteraceae bacterium]
MNRSRVRVFSTLLVAAICALSARVAVAQQNAPLLWFQGTRLIFAHAVASGGDLAVATSDAGLRRFLDKLGATLSYEPGQRYVVVTSEDRRTIVFTVGDPSYTVAGVRARAAFAPSAAGADVVLPFYALARALYVEPVADGAETVLQPRIGALDVRTEGGRTVVTVRAAMPLLATTDASAPDRLRITFVGQGSSLAPVRRAPGGAVDEIGIAVGGSARVPTTTLTIAGARGASYRIVQGDAPDTFTAVFEPHAVAYGAPPTPPPLNAAAPTAAPYPGGEPNPPPASNAPPPSAAQPAGPAAVTGLSIDQGADDALVVRVSLSAPATYEWHRLLDNRWYVDFANTTLTMPGRDEQPSFGAVQSVRVAQTGTPDAPAVRVAFTMTGRQQVDVAPDDGGVTITVRTTPAPDDVARTGLGQTGAFGAEPPAAEAQATPNAEPWKFTPAPGAVNGSRIIVIDPGHGGDDAGTVHNGLVEKNLTIDIARRLRALLIAQGWTVRMTRDSDIDPVSAENLAKMRADGKPNPDDRAYLQTRCDVANLAHARLFISIHANSAPVASARGTTFYWYKPQDAPFAQALERAVIPVAGTQDDGTQHANFYVIRHTTMPAVLIETAFVTNPGDVALLRQPAFLQNLAQGIADGVKAYAGSPSSQAVSVEQ